jgi:signal transduction histidine kinase
MDTHDINHHINLLVLEDSDDDFELIQRELKRSGMQFDAKRIDNEIDLQEALLAGAWDLMLSDYNLPQTNAMKVVEILRELSPELPCVVISGSIGEEQAVDLIKAGAADYLMKDRLARLPSVIARELRESAKAKERRALERELRHLQKIEALGTLASGIVHDVNNSLTAICGYGELALDDLDPEHPVYEFVQQILRAAQRSRDTARRILRFSRRDEGEAIAERLDIAVPVNSACAMLQITLPKVVTISHDIVGGRFHCLGSPQELEQVLVNMVTNASHAIGMRGGAVKLSLEPHRVEQGSSKVLLAPGDYYKLSVVDNGSGISPEVMPHIFEPFFTTKPAGEGTGLGLAQAKRVMEEMGGGIDCESSVGQGSTFNLYLPALDAIAEVSPAVRPVTVGNGEHILVVDDDALIVELTAKLLKQAGYRVTRFYDPASALSALLSKPESYDLVLSDLAMPMMTGLELARAIRQQGLTIPIIIHSGHINRDASQSFADCNALLPKPCTREELFEAVGGVLAARA